jgi:hypothetical protein
MSEKIKIKGIKKDAIIDVPITGIHYQFIQAVFIRLVSQKGQEEMAKALAKIQSNAELDKMDPWEIDVQTMAILVNAIEEAAEKQDKMIEEEIDIPNES